MLEDGNVYIGGRDPRGVPSLMLCIGNLKKIDKALATDLSNALGFCLMVIRKYCMVPKYIEKFNFIIDLCESKIKPQKELIKGIMSLFQDNFNGFSGQTFIYRPSKGFMLFWKIISVFIPENTREKVQFVPKGKEDEFSGLLIKDELQEVYGGSMPNLQSGQFWPPMKRQEYGEPKPADNEELVTVKSELFTLLGPNDSAIFKGDPQAALDNMEFVCVRMKQEPKKIAEGLIKAGNIKLTREGGTKPPNKNLGSEGKPAKRGFWDRILNICCCSGRDKLEERAEAEKIAKEAAHNLKKETSTKGSTMSEVKP